MFVAGTSTAEKALPFADAGELLGRGLALADFDIVCGPGTGIAEYIVRGFRSVFDRGSITYILPTAAEMARSGEVVDFGADVVIETEMDYPTRDIFQVRVCDGIFILTGGDATLQEALPALGDYAMPVAAVRGTGIAVQVIETLLQWYPSWNNRLTIGDEVDSLLEIFIAAVRKSGPIGPDDFAASYNMHQHL